MLTHSNLVSNLIDSSGHLSFETDDSVLVGVAAVARARALAMYMYLYHGMAVYFGESLETIGPNLREVRPTIFVGVPRIFEKIFARVKEKTAEKGRLNVAILNWAVAVGKEHARLTTSPSEDSGAARVETQACGQADVFEDARRRSADEFGLLVSGGAALPEELALHLHRRRIADRAGLRFD